MEILYLNIIYLQQIQLLTLKLEKFHDGVAIAKNTLQFQTMRKDFYADTDSL